jgi:hypothetical protein
VDGDSRLDAVRGVGIVVLESPEVLAPLRRDRRLAVLGEKAVFLRAVLAELLFPPVGCGIGHVRSTSPTDISPAPAEDDLPVCGANRLS